jgi:hypothetical protein
VPELPPPPQADATVISNDRAHDADERLFTICGSPVIGRIGRVSAEASRQREAKEPAVAARAADATRVIGPYVPPRAGFHRRFE